MRFGSVCSGIEAASVAWHSLGWRPAFYSEIEKFPREVLAHHYPDVPLHGDFTTIRENEYGSIDLLVGGTPCQSFSIAGLRKGLSDQRGNLALEYLKLAQRERPSWLVWENVTGVLSSNEGRDFGSFLGGLAELGYGFAYRVLDAKYFGVPQLRRRVMLVGYFGDWRPCAAVLLERQSLGLSDQSKRERALESSYSTCITRNYSRGVHSGGETYIRESDGRLRRITPTEAERLFGFPDGYTDIRSNTPDAPRYRALGNSMAVPVMSWIGQRIQEVDNLIKEKS